MFFRGRSKEGKEAGEPGHEARDSPEALLFDDATGLYKSWYFQRRLHEEVQKSARYGRAFALVLWEPRLLPGEVLADEIIARVSDVIKEGLRQTDLASQLERTRFAALLVESERNTARTVAYRVKNSLSSRVRAGPGTWRTGLAIFPDDGVDVATLLQVAVRKLSEDVGVPV
jgi:GGDEF domain-containing protein